MHQCGLLALKRREPRPGLCSPDPPAHRYSVWSTSGSGHRGLPPIPVPLVTLRGRVGIRNRPNPTLPQVSAPSPPTS